MTNIMQQRVLTSDRSRAPLALTAYPHQQPQSLAELSAAPGRAVTILDADRRDNAVVLRQAEGTGTVQVLINGQDRSLRADIRAVPVTDPATALRLAQQAVAWALTAERAAADRVSGLVEQDEEQQRRHTRELAEIRSYAIDRHRDGDICREGLDKFLARFDLDPYQPLHRVQFTITGSFYVKPNDDASTGYTKDDVREYLGLDTDQVDNVDLDTLAFDVTVDVKAHSE
ncbi:hypothetical protein [Plantactinospora sp. CA-290183]|uniref:hypothetical protein n=1 Tax=Plantactinospora sp. CA-290183 TaxID=3240006 RepID=UPI003D8FCD43